LLINIEEANTLRPAERYRRTSSEGETLRVQPDIHLSLYVLFVARFKHYEDALSYLSLIIQHFQRHRVFDQQNSPELSEQIDKLILELITLPLSEQNDLWGALRTTYQPSVLYKVNMVVFKDEDAQPVPSIRERELRASP
jgi:hypothetical protein